MRPEHLRLSSRPIPGAALSGAVGIVEHLGNATIVYVETPAGRLIVQGDGKLGASPGETVGLTLDESAGSSFGAGGGGAIAPASARRLSGQPQHDVLVVVAEAAAEDIDSAGMARVGLDLYAQPDRVVAGNVEILRGQGPYFHAVDE